MYKKSMIILLTLLMGISLFGEKVSVSNAKRAAMNFINSKEKANYQIIARENILHNKTEVGYVFQLEPAGFIAVPSDSDVSPIMAYSFNNNLILEEDNLIYYMLKEDIPKRVLYTSSEKKEANHILWEQILSNQREMRDFQQWPAPGNTSTDGWVDARWYQSGIYNAFCPLDNTGQRSVVGCVATAMAMIIDFHKYIGNAHFTNADDYYSGWYSDFRIDDDYVERDFPSFPQLNAYLDDLGERYENGETLTNTDKAALSFACGVSVEMGYSSQGSGAWTESVTTAITNKFGFVSAYYQNNYGNSFYNNLMTNMKNMEPAELSIRYADGSNGHAIVCDGYNTDDYYHLNFGWGASDNTCWYQLPDGMPYNYSLLEGAAVNMEGGDIPVQVTGTVNMTGASSVGTYIKFEGDNGIFESYVTSNNGSYEIPAMNAGTYTATAINGRVYYATQVVTVSAGNHIINFDMGNYEALTGTVSAPIDPTGTTVDIYKDGELAYSGVCQNSNGFFSIAGVLPGTYIATASLGDGYFESKELEVTADNQVVNFDLVQYPGNMSVGYHKTASDKWTLIPNYTISCGIKLTSEELSAHTSDLLAKVSFIAPVSSSQAEIFAQLWEGNNLLSEKEITEFSEGEWITNTFDRFIIPNPEKEYYVAYKITCQTNELAYADNGPQVVGRGAFFHTTGWQQLPASSFNKNFCIEAGFISQEYAMITGHISTSDNWQNLEQGVIVAQNYMAHSDTNGDYTLILKEGTYDITAMLPEHIEQVVTNISAINGETTANIDFNLLWGTSNDEDIINADIITLTSYPNPFTRRNTKSNITIKYSGKTTNPVIKIYNLKGECVKTINAQNQKSVIWDARDSNGKQISSGIYFYRLIDQNKILKTNKMLILR